MEFEALGDTLAKHLASAGREVLLVAPFVTKGALEFLLHPISAAITPVLVTRWRVEEIAAGVSDVESYGLVRERGGSLWLHQSLHAKYFRADEAILVGSANVTATALGLTSTGNLEVLQPTTRDSSTDAFERTLFDASFEVDESFAQQMLEMQIELRAQHTPRVIDRIGTDERWLANLPRDPGDLWRFAAGSDELLSTVAQEQVRCALDTLQVPDLSGTSEDSIRRAVAGALLTERTIHDLYDFVEEPRRFGDVTDFFRRRLDLDRDEAQRVAQNVIRLVTYYLPGRFNVARPRHSEILFRTPSAVVPPDGPAC